MDAVVATHGLCALFYLVLGAALALHSVRRTPAPALIGACFVTGAWALAVAVDPAGGARLGSAAGVLRVAAGGAWLLFLALAYRTALPEDEPARGLRWLCGIAAVALALQLGLELWEAGLVRADLGGGVLMTELLGRFALAVTALYFVELLLRRSASETRWRIKHVCIGIGALYAFDLVLASEALLMRRVLPDLESSRGAVTAIAAPVIAMGIARSSSWSAQLNLARRAVVHSVVLLGVGGYLVALAGAGALSRAVGGDSATLLQATVLFFGIVAFAVLLASSHARRLVLERLNSYLFTYRHDYRDVWRRFTESLAGAGRDENLRERSLRAVAGIVGSPWGGLWCRNGGRFVREGGWAPAGAEDPSADSRFAAEVAALGGCPLDLGDARREDWIPEWLRAWENAWVLVPLCHRQELIAFIVLVRPATGSRLHREDAELLEAVAAHVAGHLAEDQRTRALEESRRFADLSRGMTFIAHDLRNLANELSLTLSNARKHIAKPDFQKDMLLSMEESVATMQRLLDRLKNGGQEARSCAPTDLVHLLRNWLRGRHASESPVILEVDPELSLPVAADPDRLVALAGHLVSNAVEAAGAGGRVSVRLRREGVDGILEVADDGPGMKPEFARDRLYHPFGSSTSGGFGIGLYECRRLVEEMGGELRIDSSPGEGTVARARVPLAQGPGRADA